MERRDPAARARVAIGLCALVLSLIVAASAAIAGRLTDTTYGLNRLPSAPLTNIVVNGDFETGALAPFTTAIGSGSGAVVSNTLLVHTGVYAARVNSNSSANSSSGIAGGGSCSGGVRIAVSASTVYTWSSYILVPVTTTNFLNARVRVAWYASPNCSGGGQLSTADSNVITTTNGSWIQVTGSGTSPATAAFAEIRLLTAAVVAGTPTSAYFDDVAMDTAPTLTATPTITPGGPTLTPTNTITQGPSQTPTGTNTATNTHTATSTPAISPTPTATHPPSTSVVISEFRTRGQNGGTDEFIELYNLSNTDVNIGGWKINGSSGCGASVSTRVTVPANLILPSHRHYLAANSSGYTGTVQADITYTVGIADNGGIALLDSVGALIDAAGMCTTTAYLEGTPLAPLSADAEQSYERKPGGVLGNGQDTNDNAADFLFNASSSNPQDLSSAPVPPTSPTPTDTPGGPTNTPTNTPTDTPTQTPSRTPTNTVTPTPCIDYITAVLTDTLTPGDTLVPGSQSDDATVPITLPFTAAFYGQNFTAANLGTNGNIQFGGASTSFANVCLPTTALSNALLPFWDDLDMTTAVTTTFATGIYTSLTGTAPSRQFNIEWRACLYDTGTCNRGSANFEIRFYEDSQTISTIYGASGDNGAGATVGVQQGTGTRFTQFSCNTAVLPNGVRVDYLPGPCGTPTPTYTPTNTSTATATRTVTATATTSITPGGPTLTPTLTHTSTPTVTPTATHGPSTSVVISEFRTRGQNLGSDEFIELYNLSNSDVNIGGWKISGSSGCGTVVSTRATIPANLILPAHRHFLAANSGGYSGTVQADITYTVGIADNGGIALLDENSAIVDAAGMCTTTTYYEGTPLAPMTANANQSYERKPGGVLGNGQDTNDNSFDFLFNSASSNPQNLLDPPVPPVGTATPTRIPTATSTATVAPTDTPTTMPTATATDTPTTVPTATATDTPTAIPTATSTNTPTFTATNTPIFTATNTPVFTATATVTVSQTPAAGVLVGHVTWQFIPQNNTRSILPITLTLKIPGSIEVNYPQQSTDSSGFFTVSVAALPAATYNWRVMAPDGVSGGNSIAGFLANCGTITLTGTARTAMENGTMKGGDANNDNLVNATDFNVLKTEFGQSGIKRSDFDNNQLVNASDFNILKGNFGQAGCGAALVAGGPK